MSQTAIEPAAEAAAVKTEAVETTAPAADDPPKAKPDRQLSTWAQIFSAIFAGLSVLVATFGFIGLIFQFGLARDNAAIATARQVYMAYDDLANKNPEFAEPDFEKIKADTKEKFVRYRSFVSHLIWAYDEMLLVYDDDPVWRASFETDVRGHLPYICAETDPGEYVVYSKKMRGLLGELRRSCPPKS